MAIQPFAMQGQTANFMLPSQALANAAEAKAAVNKNAMFDMEIKDKQNLDRAYRESGGDINEMLKNPNLGFEAGTKLQSLSAENVKAKAAAQSAKIDQSLKMLDAGAQVVAGANDQTSWDAARKQMYQMFGPEAVAQLPEQYDPAAQKRMLEQSLSFKDKLQLEQQELANRRLDQQAYYQNATIGLMQARIDASERNAERRASGSGDDGKPVYDKDLRAWVRPDGSMQKVVGENGEAIAPKKSPDGYKLDVGTRPVYDDQGNVVGAEAIPGSKLDRQNADKHSQDFAVLETTKGATASLKTKVDDLLANAEGLKGATGVRGMIPSVPGSESAKAEIALKELKDAVQLQGLAMSKAGAGSAGSMTESEWPKMEAKLQRLDAAQGYDAIVKAAKEIKDGMDEMERNANRKYRVEWEGTPYAKKASGLDSGSGNDHSHLWN